MLKISYFSLLDSSQSVHSQQTHDIDLMLFQRWATVYGAGLALKITLGLLSSVKQAWICRCWVNVADVDPTSTNHWSLDAMYCLTGGHYLISSGGGGEGGVLLK